MTVTTSDATAEAALRAASKAGHAELVENLLRSGVRASSHSDIAADVAVTYDHADIEARP